MAEYFVMKYIYQARNNNAAQFFSVPADKCPTSVHQDPDFS
jgi:hypothetical protein